MKQSKDPFEVAFEEQEDSPPDSPVVPDETETQNPATQLTANGQGDDEPNTNIILGDPSTSVAASLYAKAAVRTNKNKDEDDEEEEDNMDVELGNHSSSGDPDKMAKMQAILSQFSEEQMSSC